MTQKKKYEGYPFLCSQISWLSFNERVLQEADDASTPLATRIRFLGIFSNNLDEFFKTKYAQIKRMAELGLKMPFFLESTSPRYYLYRINRIVTKHQNRQESIYKELVGELRSHNIFLINEQHISEGQKEFLKDFFYENISPNLSVLIVEDDRALPPLNGDNIYLAVCIDRESTDVPKVYALISIPTHLDRFVVLPDTKNGDTYIMYLDDIIRHNLKRIFSTFSSNRIRAYAVKFNRDAEITIDDDISRSFLEKITRGLNRREKGDMVRLVYDKRIPKDLLDMLSKKLRMHEDGSLVAGGIYHNRRDLMGFPVLKDTLEQTKILPVKVFGLDKNRSYFDQILESDCLICTPYHNFFNLIKLLREAAIDSEVHTIKISLYRLAKKSCVVSTLINAAQNGKKVIAFVELKAKFDEKSNMYWANLMKENGIKVILEIPSLKVHSKIILIVRKHKGVDQKVVFVGTGNMNERTAKIYSDMGLLTAKKCIAKDISNAFEFLETRHKQFNYKHIWVAPYKLRCNLERAIDQEIKNKKQKLPAFIRIKVNSITDVKIAHKLYKAAEAGVDVKVICRGMCILIPDQYPNMDIISIVDGFLEHFRLYHFARKNKKSELLYLSSADIMRRNLDKRVEVAVQIKSPHIFKQVVDVFDMQWRDNTKARILNERMDNQYRIRALQEPKCRSQVDIYSYYREISRGGDDVQNTTN